MIKIDKKKQQLKWKVESPLYQFRERNVNLAYFKTTKFCVLQKGFYGKSGVRNKKIVFSLDEFERMVKCFRSMLNQFKKDGLMNE